MSFRVPGVQNPVKFVAFTPDVNVPGGESVHADVPLLYEKEPALHG